MRFLPVSCASVYDFGLKDPENLAQMTLQLLNGLMIQTTLWKVMWK